MGVKGMKAEAIPVAIKAMFFTTEENEDTLRQAQGRLRKPGVWKSVVSIKAATTEFNRDEGDKEDNGNPGIPFQPTASKLKAKPEALRA